MNYCNRVQSFINYALSNPRNISGGGIRCPCKMCKKKVFRSRCCNDASSTEKVHREIYVLVYMHKKNHMFLTIPW
jgi:hypothetical protein